MNRALCFANRKAIGVVAAVAGLIGIGACGTGPTVPDLNNASITGFSSNPTLSAANAFVLGVFRGLRDNQMHATQTLGEIGREGYDLCQGCNDLSFYLVGPITPNTFYIGPGNEIQYTDLRESQIIIAALPKIPGITTQQVAGATGFLQTIEAADLTYRIFTRDSFGIAISLNPDPTGPPAPVVSRAAAYTYILALLDSAYTNLQAGGSAFSFTLPSGFGEYSTPAMFAEVNRALRARVDINLNNYAQALTDISTSFLSTSNSLNDGVIFQFSTTSGDESTTLFQPYLRADSNLIHSAQLQPGGAPDLRTSKLTATSTLTFEGVTSVWLFTAQTSASASLPWIRNEELILMRAESEIGTGDLTDALTDINFIRTNSGGLAPLTLGQFSAPGAALAELLYEKQWSLLWENGHRWTDMKHYGLLASLPQTVSGGHIFNALPYSSADCNAYPSPKPAGCVSIAGVPGGPGT